MITARRPTPRERSWRASVFPARSCANHTLYQIKGCDKCFNTGYRGRIGIFEIMHMREGLKNLILKTFDASQIKQYALQYHMKTLRQSGIEKVLAGTTTIEEVLRVTQE